MNTITITLTTCYLEVKCCWMMVYSILTEKISKTIIGLMVVGVEGRKMVMIVLDLAFHHNHNLRFRRIHNNNTRNHHLNTSNTIHTSSL